MEFTACFLQFASKLGCLRFFPLSLAYRLKKCPPPPVVENAEVIFEDEDFQIGNNTDKKQCASLFQ